MRQKWSAFVGVVGLIAAASLLLSLSSCAHDQELIAITVQPTSQTFGASNIPVDLDAGLNVHLRALGGYLHPPVTKDITNQVTWASNTPDMVTVNSTGLLTATGNTCGNALVSATVTTSKSAANIITGYMTANVVCFTGNAPTGPTLVVNFAGGPGIVLSSPPGISCSSSCAAVFPSGTAVTLTATPTGTSTSATWSSGCDLINGNVCTISSLTANRTALVTFN